jgi:peptide/nickel transport system permease protein
LVSNIAFFLARRAINAVITLLFLVLIIFILVHIILPTPIALARLYSPNPRATPQYLQTIVNRYGLADPIWVQFYNYATRLFQGNLGTDTIYAIPVATVLLQYLPVTLELVIIGQIVGVVVGLYTGGIAASNRNRAPDYGMKAVYLTSWGAPPFLVAVLFQLMFAYWLNLLPSSLVVDPTLPVPATVTGAPILDGLIAGNWAYMYSSMQHIILPALTIAVIGFGLVTRLTRASMIDALDKDYVKLAYMKGLSKRTVVWGTAFRNALIPIITLVALIFAFSVGGAVVVEDVFDYHGMGWFTVQAIYNLDYPAIIAFTILVGLSVIIANLTADLLYAAADPRVRLT